MEHASAFLSEVPRVLIISARGCTLHVADEQDLELHNEVLDAISRGKAIPAVVSVVAAAAPSAPAAAPVVSAAAAAPAPAVAVSAPVAAPAPAPEPEDSGESEADELELVVAAAAKPKRAYTKCPHSHPAKRNCPICCKRAPRKKKVAAAVEPAA